MNSANLTSMCNVANASCKVHSFLGFSYSLVFVVGFFVNTVALHAFIMRRHAWTDTHIYMFNLVIADSALIICIPFRIYHSFFCLDKTLLCTFLIFIHFINMYSSILTTTAISAHRYFAVRFPLRVRSWRRKKETAFAVCLLIWIALLAIAAVFREDNYPRKLWTCFERCKDQPLHFEFVAILLCLGFLVPLLIVAFCSSQMISIMLKAGGESSPLQRSIVGIVTANLVVFIVCYTPLHVSIFTNFFYRPPANWTSVYLPAYAYLRVAEWISSTNCCLDSVSYYFLLKTSYPSVSV
ncbi:G-protein coupled receptor 35 [Syngnathus acus]|uniref:G-protein coupled receptor 35 n=1 Tax=Syngnathus acus TaxID=161584 RepID=UPI00188648DE|nr:G-protein coupled receptor 35 [Syngnathus acus]